MNTPTASITEADVISFLKVKTEEARRNFPLLTEVEAKAGSTNTTIYGYFGNEFVAGYGTTFEAASADLTARVGTPEKAAAQKRREAAKLLAEADAIYPAAQNEKAPAL